MAEKETIRAYLVRAGLALAALAYLAALILVISWRFPTSTQLQPMRDEPVKVSLSPSDPQAYNGAVANGLRLTVQAEQLNLTHYLGWRPVVAVSGTQQFFTKTVVTDASWKFRANRAYWYQDRDCTYPSEGRAVCTESWKQAAANQEVLLHPKPYKIPEGQVGDRPVAIDFDFEIHFERFSRSEEVEGDEVADYSTLEWVPGAPVRLLMPHNGGPWENGRIVPGKLTFDELSSVSAEHHQGIRIDLCPSCMPIRAYDCAEEVTRSTYSCIGDREQPASMSWTSTRVDLTWRRAWSDWILAGLVGTGSVAILLWFWRRLRLLIPAPPTAIAEKPKGVADRGEQVQRADDSSGQATAATDARAENPSRGAGSKRRTWERNKKRRR